MARDFKIELDNVEMINGSDDLLKDTKVTKVTITGENKLNSLNSTFESCTELTAIEGDVNLDGVSDMTEMALNTTLDELKIINPTEENIQADNSLNQVTNVKIGGTKYAKGGIQDVVGSLDWNAENFVYEDTILDNIYSDSSYSEDSKNLTISNTLEQKATSIEITGQTYENLVDGKATKNLLDEMSMQQTEGKPTQFTPHIEQPICLEYIEGQTYQNLIEGRGEYKLTDTFSTTWTESNNSIENPPSMIEIPEIWGNTVQGVGNIITAKNIVESINSAIFEDSSVNVSATLLDNNQLKMSREGLYKLKLSSVSSWVQLKSNTTYTVRCYYPAYKVFATPVIYLSNMTCINFSNYDEYKTFTTDSTGKVLFFPNNYSTSPVEVFLAEGEPSSYKLQNKYEFDKYYSLNYIQSVGDLYVDEEGSPILDEEGNEQYKLDIISSGKNICPVNTIEPEKWSDSIYNHKVCNLNLKSNTKYTISCKEVTESLRLRVYNGETALVEIWGGYNGSAKVGTFTTGNVTNTWLMCYDFGLVDVVEEIMIEEGSVKTEYEPYKEDKTTILMPQPLRSVSNGKFKDRLYWDSANNKYFIERFVGKQILNFNNIDINYFDSDFFTNKTKTNLVKINTLIEKYPNLLRVDFSDKVTSDCICDKAKGTNDYNLHWNLDELACSYNVMTSSNTSGSLALASFRIPKTYDAKDKAIEYIKSLGDITFFIRIAPEIIETKILEKPSLETYSPKTYITTSAEVQPSQMTVTNKEVKFIPLSLQPSKSYTIQLDSVGKDNKPITVNLGGATTTIQPTNDTSKHHRTSITTPSELTTDNLGLSGEGVIVNDIMLFEGNTSAIKQDVDYMDGIQSIGELIENKNLFDYTQSKLGFLSISTGGISSNTSWKYTTNLISVKPNTTYCISQASSSEFYYNIVEYNSSQSYLKGTSWEENSGAISNRVYNTFTTSSNTYYIRLGWKVSSSDIQLEEGLIPTEFRVFGSTRYRIEIETYDSRWDSI